MNTAKIERRLPLWRLEMELEQARRRFRRTEEEYRRSERDVERLRKEIELRRLETKW